MQAMHVYKNTPLDVNEEFDNTDPAKFCPPTTAAVCWSVIPTTGLLDCEFHSLTSLVLVSYRVAERNYFVKNVWMYVFVYIFIVITIPLVLSPLI